MNQLRARPTCILTALALLAGLCQAAEPTTLTVDGAIVTLAPGWEQSTKDGVVTLTPSDLPAGVACTFTLLGGEAFDGSLRERLATEWKDFEKLGSVVSDDMGTINGAGSAVELAGRSGIIQIKPGVRVHVWLLIASANHRIERMVFVTTTPETFAKYGAAMTRMINGTKYGAPQSLKPLAGLCFGFAQVKTSTEFECWIFLPEGIAYTGFPVGGPANLNLDFQRKIHNGQFGEYKLDGKDVLVTIAKNTLNLIFQDGTKLSLTFFITSEELAQSTPRVLFAHRSKLLIIQ